MTHRSLIVCIAMVGILVIGWAAGVPTASADIAWNNNSTDWLWNTTSKNWWNGSNNVAYAAGDAVVFDDTSPAGTITISNGGVGVAPASVSVSASCGTYTIAGAGAGDVIKGTGSLTKSGGSTLILNTANTYDWTTVSAGTLKLGAPGALRAGSALYFTGGTLDLNNFNASVRYLGGPGGGTVTNVSGASTSQLTVTGAEFWPNGPLYYRGDIIGNVKLIVDIKSSDYGPAGLSGNNTYTGGTVVNNGTLLATSTGALPRYNSPGSVVVASGGTLAVSAGEPNEWSSADIDTILSNATLNSGSTFGIHVASGSFGYASPMSGGFNFIMPPASRGTLVFTGAKSYSGVTTVGNGKLQLGDGIANNGSVAGDIVANGVLEFANPNAQTYSGVISGGGSVCKSGTGTLTLSGANTYFCTTVSAGTLKLGAPGALPTGSGLWGDGGTLDLNNFNASVRLLGGLGGGTITNASGASTSELTITGVTDWWNGPLYYPGSISGNVRTIISGGTRPTALSGTNTYTGGTVVNGGTLLVTSTGALPRYNSRGSVVLGSSGTLAVSTGEPNEWSSGDIDTILGNATLNSGSTFGINVDSGSFTYASPMSGAFNFIKPDWGRGTLIFTGAKDYSGVTTVNGGYGKLQLGDGTVNNGSVAGDIVANGTVEFANPHSQTYSGVISGGGSVCKSGAGTLTLSGANTYFWTTVSAGTLKLGAPGALPAGSGLYFTGGTLDLNNFNASVRYCLGSA